MSGVFFFVLIESSFSSFVMDVPVKPVCYDAVPACLCKDCQLYDVLMSSRPEPSTFWSSLSSRPSCSVAESTCGLANIYDDPKRSCVPLPDPISAEIRPFLSRPRLGFADLSSPCFSPSFAPAVSSSVVTSSSVCTVGASPVQSSSVAASSSSVASSVVAALPVDCPVSSVAASSSAVTASSSSGCPVSTASPGPVAASPVRSVAAPSVRWSPGFAAPVLSSKVQRPLFSPRPLFVPVACLVWIVVPVLIASPFGFVLSFLPLLR